MQICHLFLQHSETFDVSYVILPLTVASYQRSNWSGFLAHPVVLKTAVVAVVVNCVSKYQLCFNS